MPAWFLEAVMDKNAPEKDIFEQIQSVTANWGINEPFKVKQLKDDTARPVYEIKTDTGHYILKGFSDDVPEATIKSNVQAHLFLGNKQGLAPRIYKTRTVEKRTAGAETPETEKPETGAYYLSACGYWFYLMEYIEGRQMQETPEDEFRIGQAARKLHELKGYSNRSPFAQSKKRFYEWFRDKSFVKEFDTILDDIPDFEQLDQCFVHTDMGPHNTMFSKDGKVIFVDLDDAGIGSRYLDLGWPFIMQFVDFDHDTEEMDYRFDTALAFLRGYYGEKALTREEYDLLFYAAEQMHISYMQTYGPYAVDSLWKILRYGMDQKEVLWEKYLLDK